MKKTRITRNLYDPKKHSKEGEEMRCCRCGVEICDGDVMWAFDTMDTDVVFLCPDCAAIRMVRELSATEFTNDKWWN